MTMEITKVLDKIEAQQSKQLDLGPAASSLDLLQAVYRDPTQHLSIRMRAASMAISYECPKLIASAIINESSVADLLDRRIAKLEQMQQAKTIDVTPNETKGAIFNSKTSPNSCSAAEKTGGNTDARLSPTIPDRRFRRI